MEDKLWEDLPEPVKERPSINLWGSFLANEKLTANRVPVEMLVMLAELLCNKGRPRVRPYIQRLETRKLVCLTAMENGIDLPSFKHHGKVAMSRGLLDMWNKVYTEKYGSNYGTSGVKEATRRDVKTRLHKGKSDGNESC